MYVYYLFVYFILQEGIFISNISGNEGIKKRFVKNIKMCFIIIISIRELARWTTLLRNTLHTTLHTHVNI